MNRRHSKRPGGHWGLGCLILLLAWLLPGAALAANRLALVVGNDGYQTVPALKNARNDARLMARMLRDAKFDVTLLENVSRRDFYAGLDSFQRRIDNGDEVVFFFAGHGVQVGNNSMLLPVDIRVSTEKEVEREAVQLLDVQEALKSARVSLLVIDACRNNPFGAKTGTRAVGATRGLLPPEAARGQAIILSAGRGQSAIDGVPGESDNNGLFTSEFVKVMRQPGVEVRSALVQVRDRVEDKAARVNHEQRPSLVDDLRGEFYIFPGTAPRQGGSVAVAAPAPAASPVMSPEEEAWLAAKQWNTPLAMQTYLKAYPQGRYKTAAQLALAGLEAAAASPAVAAQPAPQPAPVAPPPAPAPQTAATNTAIKPAPGKPGSAKPGKTASPTVAALASLATPAVRTVKDCAACPELIRLAPGRYRMGSPETETGRAPNEGPAHEVVIGYPLALARSELTRGEFAQFVAATRYRSDAEKNGGCFGWDGSGWTQSPGRDWRSPGFAQTDKHPAVCLSWNDAQAYVRWLNDQAPGKNFRMPSEAEWEFAARAGTPSRFPWGDDPGFKQICTRANGMDETGKTRLPGVDWDGAHCADGFEATSPVDAFPANPWGFNGLHGNAWEWVIDVWHDSYAGGAPDDGQPWLDGADPKRRVLRGGGWNFAPRNLRSADRGWNLAHYAFTFTGVRVARFDVQP